MLNNDRGQSSLGEYILIITIVLAFAVAITVYVQRALQARMFDGRNYAVTQAREACNANCLAATGGGIAREYEPYYGHIVSHTDRNMVDSSSIEGGVNEREGIFRKSTDLHSTVNTVSKQRPPKDAN